MKRPAIYKRYPSANKQFIYIRKEKYTFYYACIVPGILGGTAFKRGGTAFKNLGTAFKNLHPHCV